MPRFADNTIRDAPCTVTIDELANGRARGTFRGTLERIFGSDPPESVSITEGTFDLPLS